MPKLLKWTGKGSFRIWIFHVLPMSEGGQMYVTLLGGCIAPFYVVPDHNAPFVYL